MTEKKPLISWFVYFALPFFLSSNKDYRLSNVWSNLRMITEYLPLFRQFYRIYNICLVKNIGNICNRIGTYENAQLSLALSSQSLRLVQIHSYWIKLTFNVMTARHAYPFGAPDVTLWILWELILVVIYFFVCVISCFYLSSVLVFNCII